MLAGEAEIVGFLNLIQFGTKVKMFTPWAVDLNQSIIERLAREMNLIQVAELEKGVDFIENTVIETAPFFELRAGPVVLKDRGR